MSDAAKNDKQLELQGLACAECSAEIEKKIQQLKGIENCSINFLNKTLSFKIAEGADVKKVFKDAVTVVKKIEPEVVIKEKSLSSRKRQVLVATDLCCRDCSHKIEEELKKINGINNVHVDFGSKRLLVDLADNYGLNDVIKEANISAGRIVKQIKISDELSVDKRKKINKLALFAAGAVLFVIALTVKLPDYAKISFYLAAYVLSGYDVVYKAVMNFFNRRFLDENSLMAIATIGAISIEQYPEAVAVMIFYKIGEFMQERAVDSSRSSIRSLMDLKPDYANLKFDTEYKKVNPEKVNVGELILVKPGERVPLDGKVVEGKSGVDTKAITGESVPRSVEPGSTIYSGFINQKSPLIVKVEKVFSESTVSRILELVENAGARKSKTENFITKFARIYTPIVVFMALCLAIIPPLIMEDTSFQKWIYRGMIFLVVSCPCALVISIPLGFFGGIGSASRKGILIKGSNYLEALNKVGTVVFDKTGTLTKGVFKVTNIKSANDFNKNELLEFAAYAESYSDHPIANSIKDAFPGKIDTSQIKEYNEKSGIGIDCTIDGKRVLCGNSKLMALHEIKYTAAETPGTVVYMAVNGVYAGYIIISDEIKASAKSAIALLKENGVARTAVLSGDNKAIASRTADTLGIDEVYAELLPEQKVNMLEEIEKRNKAFGKVVFVGDGINDAPVITRSDIGVAMGGLGVDAAIESADVVIMNDDPVKISEAIDVAGRTRNIVLQNITFALAVKIIVLALGALGMASMWEAVFADVGVAVLAILNSSRV
ncbi:heavy metal translocating P-type ATPase [Lentisphaerota bacterium ZTH]|nr:cadmium-translocating P-type ATPase [Lentisphaerota bacterium]WET06284.1 heavy metal translocating P-type ATPase [Lentisphaerota bacterium ZTH]